jgi:hypothetical protein
MKYDKQDQQGKAAFNERNSHPTISLVQTEKSISFERNMMIITLFSYSYILTF